jgi:hypothetical protein
MFLQHIRRRRTLVPAWPSVLISLGLGRQRQFQSRLALPNRACLINDTPHQNNGQVVRGAAGVLIIRAVLPAILTWLVNIGLRKTPGYRGRVRRVNFEFITPRLVVQDLTLGGLDGGQPAHHFEVGMT